MLPAGMNKSQQTDEISFSPLQKEKKKDSQN